MLLKKKEREKVVFKNDKKFACGHFLKNESLNNKK